MTNLAEGEPAGLAVSKPANSISIRTWYIEAGPNHDTAGHGQAGQDMVPAGPQAAAHDYSRLLLSRLGPRASQP